MNPIGDMAVRVVGDNSSFDKSIDNSSKKLTTFGDLASTVGKVLSVALTAGLTAAGYAALKSAGDFQLYNASFETMLGNADAASKMIAEMQALAASTPFELKDLAESGKMLLQYGISAEKIIPTIQTLGDISQGNSQKLNSLSLAFGQMSSTGRLMGQDLLQMINAGFNPLKEISDKTGVSIGILKDQMSKGQISAEMVTESFMRATSAGGQFFGGMEKASKTLPGLISTLKDDVGTLGRSFVEDMMPKIMEGVKSLSAMAKTITDLDGPTKTFILTILGFAAAAGPVVLAIGKISTAFTFLAANPVVLVVAGIVAVTAAVVALANAINKSELEKLEKQYGELSKRTGVLPDDIYKITDALNRQASAIAGTGFGDMLASINEMSESLKIPVKNIVEIALASDKVTGTYRTQLEALKQQIETENRLKNTKEQNATLAAANANAEIARQKELADQEKKNIQAQIDGRKIAASEYEKANKETFQMLQVGLINEKEAYDKNISATQDYAQKLTLLGYVGKEVNGVWSIGDKALAKAKESLDKNTDSINAKERALNALEAGEKRNLELIKQSEEKNKAIAELTKSTSAKAIQNAKEEKEKRINFAKEMYDGIMGLAQAISNLVVAQAQNQVDAINEVTDKRIEALSKQQEAEKETLDKSQENFVDALRKKQEAEDEALGIRQEAQINALDAELQEVLYSQGLTDAATVAQLQKEYDDALLTGDAITIAKAEEALRKAKIEEDFANRKKLLEEKQVAEKKALDEQQAQDQKKLKEKQAADDKALLEKQDRDKAKIQEDSDKRTRKILYDAATLAWNIQLGMTVAAGARAAIESFVNAGGWPWGVAPAAIMGSITAAEVALMYANKPRLATGGIVQATPGGRDVTVAEAGQAEAVIPLDQLDNMLSSKSGFGEGVDKLMQLIVNLDSKPFLDTIFPATQNRTVLISGGSVV